MRRYDEAILESNRALALQPWNVTSQQQLLRAAVLSEDQNLAQETFDRLCSMAPAECEGVSLESAGQPDAP